MAAKKQVVQNQESISLYRESFYRRVVLNKGIELLEYRVLMLLMTELDGFADWERLMSPRPYNDPRNFRKISKGAIANSLGIEKSEVKKALSGLIEKHLVEKGSSSTCTNGYRLTF